MQNMSYGNLIYNKIKTWFFQYFRTFWDFRKCILVLLVCLYYKFIFLMRLSDSVSFSVYMTICYKIVWTNVVKMFQKCEQYSYELSFVFVCGFGVNFGSPKWSPHPHPRRQCQRSLPGEKYRIYLFSDFRNIS